MEHFKTKLQEEEKCFFLEFFVVVLYLRLDFLAFLSFINVKQDFSKLKYAMLWIQNVLYFMQRSESINKNMPRPWHLVSGLPINKTWKSYAAPIKIAVNSRFYWDLYPICESMHSRTIFAVAGCQGFHDRNSPKNLHLIWRYQF